MQEAQGWPEEDLPDGLYDEFFENQDDDAPDYEHQLQEMQIDNESFKLFFLLIQNGNVDISIERLDDFYELCNCESALNIFL